jgi:hypothetical protein
MLGRQDNSRVLKEFLVGFSKVTDLEVSQAYGLWMSYTKMLPEDFRKQLEAGGCMEGYRQGQGFISLVSGVRFVS